jgi:hypothetical protein
MDPIRSAVLALGAALGICAPQQQGDTLVDRCIEVIRYRHPSFQEIGVTGVERSPGTNRISLEFEAVSDPSGPPINSYIECGFDAEGRWTLEAVAIGGRALPESEVALVNSELLLLDLSRNPERLQEPER